MILAEAMHIAQRSVNPRRNPWWEDIPPIRLADKDGQPSDPPRYSERTELPFLGKGSWSRVYRKGDRVYIFTKETGGDPDLSKDIIADALRPVWTDCWMVWGSKLATND